jgi:hypothetical protein
MRSHRGKAILVAGGVAAAAAGTAVLAPGGGGARPCPGGPKNSADPTCSGIAQDDLAFTDALSKASTS